MGMPDRYGPLTPVFLRKQESSSYSHRRLPLEGACFRRSTAMGMPDGYGPLTPVFLRKQESSSYSPRRLPREGSCSRRSTRPLGRSRMAPVMRPVF
jgi:hypothetical protein